MLKKTNLLYLAILIEGYVVLASELLAIRQLVPFVGSGVETTSIVISAVLLPLAIGYHQGGVAFAHACAKERSGQGRRQSIRNLLLRNILIALCFISAGFSFLVLKLFFMVLLKLGIVNPLAQTFVYSALFLIMPMFLLGQTVPLVSHYFSRMKLSTITGRMLFFSTMGAFGGSLFSTLVLMSYAGVHNTVIFTAALLALLGLLVTKKKDVWSTLQWIAPIMIFVVFLNGNGMMRDMGIISDNAYNIIWIDQANDNDDLYLVSNRAHSSKLAHDRKDQYPYMNYTEAAFIDPYLDDQAPPRDILVIGAGGFQFGAHDFKDKFTFVDIDPDIKDVVEGHFIKAKLPPNKKFVAASARSFLLHNRDKYDFILLDIYNTQYSLPMEAVTREFLLDVKAHLKKGGVVVSNIIGRPNFSDKFSVRYYNTFSSVFHGVNRIPMAWYRGKMAGDVYNRVDTDAIQNILHVYVDGEEASDTVVYTDNKSTFSMDVQ